MKRRAFVVGAGSMGAGFLAGCGGKEGGGGPAVVTKKKVTWRLASSFPRGLDTIYGAAEQLASALEQMSDGQFKLRTYPAGELVPGLQVMDAVQQGTVQIGHTASYYYTGKHPALAFDTSVPFGLSPRQQTAWLTAGGGGQVLDPIYADFNIVRLLGGNTGAQMGGWFNREINGVEDLKGLKIRIPGLGGEVMNRLGATVQVLAGGDIYPALERGAIDATEWIGPYDDEKLGFNKVAKYYYYPGFWEPGPALVFLVSKKAYDELPKSYQAMLQAAAEAASLRMLALYDARNPEALARLRGGGVDLRAFPEDVLRKAKEVTEALMLENASKDPTYKKVFDHFSAFRKASFEWFSLAEQSYAQFSFPAKSG